MSHVYALLQCTTYEGSSLLGVYQTFGAADEAQKQWSDQNTLGEAEYLEIVRVEIGAPPEYLGS